MEQDLVAKGVHPFSLDWPEHSKNWFFMHGGALDTESEAPCMSPIIREAVERLFNILDDFACGVFMPRREKDGLMYALLTPEHLGQTRGKGSMISW
jgi:hypothetical protein